MRSLYLSGIQYVYLTSWLGTLALLDLFVFDTSYICLDRSGLRILIVDHMMMMMIWMMITIISLSLHSDTTGTVVSDGVFVFAFLLRPMS